MTRMARVVDWVVAQPGQVVGEGQPYAIAAMKGQPKEWVVTEMTTHTVLVDGGWRSPVDLPVEPTWGVVIWFANHLSAPVSDSGCWQLCPGDEEDLFRVERTEADSGRVCIDATLVKAFIPFTEEQTKQFKETAIL